MSLPYFNATSYNNTDRQTRWCVITGAPCSGKTTVINALEKKGCRVVPEAARAYIDDQLARGLDLTEIRSDALVFERHILMDKIRTERQLPVDETIFLDRAVPDSIAYFLHAGLDPDEPTKASRRFKYRQIFFLNRLPCATDSARMEDNATAESLEVALKKSYVGLGYPLTRIPVLPVELRVDLILQHI